MKRIVVALIAAGLLVPGFVLAQDTPPSKGGDAKTKKKTPAKSKKGKKEEPKKEAGK